MVWFNVIIHVLRIYLKYITANSALYKCIPKLFAAIKAHLETKAIVSGSYGFISDKLLYL